MIRVARHRRSEDNVQRDLMRIGIDLSPLAHSARRGIGAYARALVDALGDVGPEHEYVLIGPIALEGVRLPPRHRLWHLPPVPFGRLSALVSHQAILPVVARQAKIDVLHVIDVPMVPSHPAAPRWKTVPQVITLHDLTPLHAPPLLRKRRWRAFYRLSLGLCRRADALVVDSQSSRDDALQARIAPPDRLFVAPLARPHWGEYLPEPAELPPIPYGIHIGGDDWNKNRETVLRAFTEVNVVRPFCLALVGGSPATYAGLPAEIRGRVVHYPWLEPATLRALYEHAAMLVFPSRYEGFGLPILEAMAAGTPVITSARGATREVAGDAALLVEPDSAEDIAHAVLRILGDERLAGDLRRRGRAREAQFDWSTTARATLTAYQHALHAPRCPR